MCCQNIRQEEENNVVKEVFDLVVEGENSEI